MIRRSERNLPDKVEAAAALPLGFANKAHLALDEPELFPADSHLFGRTDTTETCSYHLRPLRRPLIEVYAGGAHAERLERDGAPALAAFAIEELAALVGSDLRHRLRPLSVTRWRAAPLIRGAYSHARPGHADARAALAAPVENRLFFAGEACSVSDYSTAHGAHDTGAAAARAALAAVGGAIGRLGSAVYFRSVDRCPQNRPPDQEGLMRNSNPLPSAALLADPDPMPRRVSGKPSRRSRLSRLDRGVIQALWIGRDFR